MGMKISLGTVSALTLLVSSAFGGEEPAKTVKQAILRTVDLSIGRHLFDRGGAEGKGGQSSTYLPVAIHGTLSADGSIKVVIGLPHPRQQSETTDLTAHFSVSGVKVTPRLVREDEYRICSAVKTVLMKYLAAGETKVDVSLYVQKRTKELYISVNPIPSSPGRHTLFIVNEKGQIESEIGGGEPHPAKWMATWRSAVPFVSVR
jgi:hypothetical protein